ncbi:zinc-finger domain-containing protein [Roseospirillum parvum]|uniref:Uncharacterized conserved protein, contains Zn-finger domain n=1 Tax=Roseospirillum parvum TaxID=83401 RepID=A0A1G7TU54_9PROT|nr:Uncharacterized conserved protein, contains Zn-finger domain [Roseospirillum parvum]
MTTLPDTPAQANQVDPAERTVMTRETRVMCDGGEGPLGHPAVYLSIRPDVGEEICPYCSRRFVLDRGDRAA